MAVAKPRDTRSIGRFSTAPLLPRLFRLAILVTVDSLVVWFVLRLVALGYTPFAAAIIDRLGDG